ncbi:MAG: hypothetical protein ACLQDQ_10335 [Myxococcaceae bacterium]
MPGEGSALSAPRQGLAWPVIGAGWTLLAAFLSLGMPPVVDLPVQAAQLETLAGLVRGDPLLSQVYELRWTPGYGLVHWLFLPVALLANGSVAARLAWFTCLELYALGSLLLIRQLKRPDLTLLLTLPFAFGISYYYGFLSELFARDLAILTLAAFCVSGGHDTRGVRSLFCLGMFATWLAHLFIFCVLLGVLAAVVAAQRFQARSVRLLLLGAAGPLILTLPALLAVGDRSGAFHPVYDLYAHTPGWFFRLFRTEGLLSVALPLLLAAVMAALAWRQRHQQPRAPIAAVLMLVAMFVLCPRSFYLEAGFNMANVRLPALMGLAAVLAADVTGLPRLARGCLYALTLVSLAETALFHHQMREAVAGLSAVERTAPAGRHATLLLSSQALPGTRLPYLEHVGEWVTASRGGVGHHLLADSPHFPVHFRPGMELPTTLGDFTPAQLAQLDEVFVFGEGDVPPQLAGFCERIRVKRWRRLDPCAAGVPSGD